MKARVRKKDVRNIFSLVMIIVIFKTQGPPTTISS